MEEGVSERSIPDEEILRFASLITDEALRTKVLDLIGDPTVLIEGELYHGLPLKESPAAKVHHHAYPSGLVQHMVSVATFSLTLCDIVQQVYSAEVSRDIVIAAALIHDIMKPLTYSQTEDRYGMSPLGERVDHLTLAVAELIHRGFPLEVIHAVAAHHGKGGPTYPRTIEALICNLADTADANLNGEILNAAKWAVKDCLGEEVRRLTAGEAFSIVRARQEKGCTGVVEAVKKMRPETKKDKT